MTQLYTDLVALDKAFVTKANWARLKWYDPDAPNCHCLVGKIEMVTDAPLGMMGLYHTRVRDITTALGFVRPADAMAYNDNRTTTFSSLKARIQLAINKHKPKAPKRVPVRSTKNPA